MAKTQPKKKGSPIKLIAGVGAAIIIGILAFPPDDSKPTTATKSTTKKKVAGQDDYTKADYDAAAQHPFGHLTSNVVDAFKPAVVRNTVGKEETKAGEFPMSLGGPGWSYSGMAVVDGVGEGILENSNTGETVFLKRGQKWQGVRAADIYADHMVLVGGPTGPISVNVQESKETTTNTPASAQNAPILPAPAMPVPMMGAIGGASDLNIVQDNSQDTGGYGRRGRRGRRNAG